MALQMNPEERYVDPAVLARRKYHEAAAKFCARWLIPLYVFFSIIGLVFVLAPSIIIKWRLLIEGYQLSSFIFYQCSTFGKWNILWITIMILFSQVKLWTVTYKKVKYLSQEEQKNNKIFGISYKEIVEKNCTQNQNEKNMIFGLF